MRSILIVDDEKFIRQGICTIIRRLGFFDEVHEAQNGKEALEFITENNIDIMMTDIKMPVMDGIELIKKVRSLQNKLKIIILSGHDDFSYAKEAVANRVSAYLLKPIDREELNSTIVSLLNDIDEERKNQERQETADTLISNVVANELNFIFLHNDIKPEAVELVLKNLNLSIFKKPFYISLIMPLGDDVNSNILDHLINEQSDEFLCIKNTNEQYTLITNERPTNELINKLNSQKEFEYVQSVGLIEEKNPCESYKQAAEALKYRVLCSNSILYYEDFADRKTDYNIPDREFDKMLNMIHANRYDEAIKLLGELFDDNGYSIDYFEKCAKSFYNNVLVHIASVEIPKFKDIYNFDSIKQYVALASDYFVNYSRSKVPVDSSQNKEIDIAIQYINENYHKDLNLAMVSNHVSLSYSYFSLVFKEKTGLCFTDYLKKVRIFKAKELLKSTDKKIYVISEMVGYENPKQFMKMFRKETGISPSEFREL